MPARWCRRCRPPASSTSSATTPARSWCRPSECTTRGCKLAAQGLPEGKSSGLDLINKDPGFGVSQFMENARYQYALETELARTISIAAGSVAAARVHLAIPQQSAFVRDRRPASASVLLQLRPGGRLEPEQVSAIVHLVASSIPELTADQVTVVDQQGRLLSSPEVGAVGDRRPSSSTPRSASRTATCSASSSCWCRWSATARCARR